MSLYYFNINKLHIIYWKQGDNINNLEYIIALVTPIVAFIFGELSKKHKWFKKKFIKYQNIAIGVIGSIIYVLIQDEYSITIAILVALSGLTSGGIYDAIHDCKKGENNTNEEKN